MKKNVDKIIEDVIKTLTIDVDNFNKSKLQLAYDLHWARNVINWKLTTYGGWGKFCAANVKLSTFSISIYISIVDILKTYKYTEKEATEMIKGCGWHNFRCGLFDINRKYIVATFIKRYHNYDAEYNAGYKPDKHGDQVFTVGLPSKHATKLTAYLTAYGMRVLDSGRRVGVREAFMKLIDKKLK